MRLTARVPATAANLGPGFDCFGLALDLWNEVTIDTDAEPVVTWEGEGADELPTDGSDMVSRAMAHAAALHDEQLPAFSLHGVNHIPLERGLGSSAAAIVAGTALSQRLTDLEDRRSLLFVAASIEGHGDNVAAAIHGGLTVAFDTEEMPPSEGSPRVGVEAIRFDTHPDVRPVMLIPENVRLPTHEARAALSTSVSRTDTVFNLSHAALVVAALTERPSLLSEALRDRLHQDARLAFVPSVRSVFHDLRAAGIPVCVSGAGPSLLAFEGGDGAPGVPGPGEGWRVLRLEIAQTGMEVREAS